MLGEGTVAQDRRRTTVRYDVEPSHTIIY